MGHTVSKETREKISNSNKGRIVSEETRNILSTKIKGRSHTEEVLKKMRQKAKERRGENNPSWKGGYRERNIPTYDVCANQIDWIEECRRNKKDTNILEVKCTYCGKWFVPSRYSVYNRIKYLKGNGQIKGEQRFYCSEGCKKECPIYHKKPEQIMKEDAIRAGRLN